MALLERAAWYDIARTTNWTPSYVTESELFPDIMTGAQGVPMETWETYDEPYKTSYPEYVSIQREKDAGAYSVKAALRKDARAKGVPALPVDERGLRREIRAIVIAMVARTRRLPGRRIRGLDVGRHDIEPEAEMAALAHQAKRRGILHHGRRPDIEGRARSAHCTRDRTKALEVEHVGRPGVGATDRNADGRGRANVVAFHGCLLVY